MFLLNPACILGIVNGTPILMKNTNSVLVFHVMKPGKKTKVGLVRILVLHRPSSQRGRERDSTFSFPFTCMSVVL